jgi:putative hemolysin
MSLFFRDAMVALAWFLAGGLLAAAGAIYSSRLLRSRNGAGAERTRRLSASSLTDARVALATRFGVLFALVLASVVVGRDLAAIIAQTLQQSRWNFIASNASMLALATITFVVATAAYLITDLVPTRLALSGLERFAAFVGRPLRIYSAVISPLVGSLDALVESLFRLLRIPANARPQITEEEIQHLVREGTKVGVLEEAQKDVILRVFRFAERRARALMTPRDEIVWIDLSDPLEAVRRKVLESPYSRFPVCDQSLDNLLGVVHVKNLLGQSPEGLTLRLQGVLSLPLFLYEGTKGPRILETFKSSGSHFAVVLDEYGSVAGLLTLNDIVESLVGNLPEHDDDEPTDAVQRADGSWLFDGRFALDEFRELLEIEEIPEGDFDTLGGFLATQLGHIPRVAESLEWNGLRFEVVDMDAKRVDKVLVNRVVGHNGPNGSQF